MTTRILPPEEWSKLAGTEADAVIPHLATLHAQAMVVEQDGAVVGSWLLIPMWHAECLWIAPAHRGKSSVGRRLLRGLRAAATTLGIDRVWTGSMDVGTTRLLAHYGAAQMPGEHFVMTMRKS